MATSLASLRQSVRERADMEFSQFVTDTELNSYIQGSYAELYDIIVSRFEDYYSTEYPFTVGVDAETTLPVDFYKMRGIDLNRTGGNNWITVSKWIFTERNQGTRGNNQLIYGVNDVQYRVMGNKVKFLPVSSAPGSYRMWYIPKVPVLSDVVDLDGVNGWEEYVIIDAAIKCLVKEESDVSVLLLQKNQMLQRIEALASNRDAGDPERVGNVQSNYGNWGGFWGDY